MENSEITFKSITTNDQKNAKLEDVDSSYEIITDGTSWTNYENNEYLPTFRTARKDDGSVSNTGIAFGWEHLRPFGYTSLDSTILTVEGESHGMRMSWVSWSDWTTKLPCLVNEANTGGIAFPEDGNTILFGRGKRWDIASRG